MRANDPLLPLGLCRQHKAREERSARESARMAYRLAMTSPSIVIRPATPGDYAAWRPLWDGYNAFYGRHGETALPDHVTQITWQRFFDPNEPVFALVEDEQARLVGLAHYLFHRSMTKIEPVCYLSDLFTDPAVRGRGIGRSLIEAACAHAKAAGASRVYWQTHETNAAGRQLYDKVARHLGFIVYSREL
jgi:GNAT superfamily N-acetyltransferase